MFSGNFHHIYLLGLFLFFLDHIILSWILSFLLHPQSSKAPLTHLAIFEFHSICVLRAFKGRTNLFLSFLLTLWSELGSRAIDFCLCIVLMYCSSVIFQTDKGPIADGGFPLSDQTPAQLSCSRNWWFPRKHFGEQEEYVITSFDKGPGWSFTQIDPQGLGREIKVSWLINTLNVQTAEANNYSPSSQGE